MRTNKTINDGGIEKPVFKCDHCKEEFHGLPLQRSSKLSGKDYCSRECRRDALLELVKEPIGSAAMSHLSRNPLSRYFGHPDYNIDGTKKKQA